MQNLFLIFLYIPNIPSNCRSPFTHAILCPSLMRIMWAILISVRAFLIYTAWSMGHPSCNGPNPSCSSWAIHPHPSCSSLIRWAILIPSHPSRWILIHPMGQASLMMNLFVYTTSPLPHRFARRPKGRGGLGVCVQIIQKGPNAFEVKTYKIPPALLKCLPIHRDFPQRFWNRFFYSPKGCKILRALLKSHLFFLGQSMQICGSAFEVRSENLFRILEFANFPNQKTKGLWVTWLSMRIKRR